MTASTTSTLPDQPIARTGREAWESLSNRAGLSVTGLGQQGYDDVLVATLRSELVGDRAGDLAELIEQLEVSVTQLVNAFLRSVEPFARMMSDTFEMFENAGARQSDSNVRLAVTFDDLEQPESFDLDSFREQIHSFRRVVAMCRRRAWRIDNLWKIPEIVAALPAYRAAEAEQSADPASTAVSAWIEAMRNKHAFPPLPPRPPLGSTEADALLDDLWGDFSDFQELARTLFTISDRAWATQVQEEEASGWDPSLMGPAASDQWPRQPVEALIHLSRALRIDPTDSAASAALVEIGAFVTSISGPPEPIDRLIAAVEDILKLPAWQRRHELYAVWVFARVIRRFPDELTEFHCPGGTLSFPFRRTLLASIGDPAKARLELWSELRSEASSRLIGRKNSIQPDYTLKFPGNAGPGSGSDLLVVECKHYRKSSPANFSAALSDYARNSEATIIALVNYGPVGASVLKRVDADVVDRCAAIGAVRPGGGGLQEFERLLDGISQGAFGSFQTGWLQDLIGAQLCWDTPGVDLDLHVATSGASCGFETPGALEDAQFTGDDLGAGTTQSSELITIVPMSSEIFHFVVVAYGGVDRVSTADATLTLRWRGRDGHHHVKVVALTEAHAPAWHVATFTRGASRPTIVNRAATGFISGRGWTPPT